MKKYCAHCGARLKISQALGAPPPPGVPPTPGAPLAGAPGPGPGLGLPPLGEGLGLPGGLGPGGMPPAEKEIDVEAKEEIKKTILDVISEDIEKTEDIILELREEGWSEKRLRELFPEKTGGIEGFIDKVKAEELGESEEPEEKIEDESESAEEEQIASE